MKNPKRQNAHVPVRASSSSKVVSKEGAVLRVERIELSDAARKRLTANVDSIGARKK